MGDPGVRGSCNKVKKKKVEGTFTKKQVDQLSTKILFDHLVDWRGCGCGLGCGRAGDRVWVMGRASGVWWPARPAPPPAPSRLSPCRHQLPAPLPAPCCRSPCSRLSGAAGAARRNGGGGGRWTVAVAVDGGGVSMEGVVRWGGRGCGGWQAVGGPGARGPRLRRPRRQRPCRSSRPRRQLTCRPLPCRPMLRGPFRRPCCRPR